MYLTYEKYGEMGGQLDSHDFMRANRKATAEIDKHTFGRLKNMETIPERVVECAFELVEIYCSDSSRIASVSNDGVSVTYKTSETTNDVKDAISTFLNDVIVDGVPLLYAGVD